MRVLIDLEIETLKDFEELAAKKRMSRKAFMEMILIEWLETNEYPIGKPISGKDIKLLINPNPPIPQINDFTKENATGKSYNPNDNPRFKSKNKLK